MLLLTVNNIDVSIDHKPIKSLIHVYFLLVNKYLIHLNISK